MNQRALGKGNLEFSLSVVEQMIRFISRLFSLFFFIIIHFTFFFIPIQHNRMYDFDRNGTMSFQGMW